MPNKETFLLLLLPLLLTALYFGGRGWYLAPKISAEETAANFTAVRADGQKFSLSDLRGGYVLLDFWGSWCRPCRKKSPELVSLNKQTKDHLTIVSISLENDSTAWQKALLKDSRTWPYQVIEDTENYNFIGGEIAFIYGIKKVPTNFLIDPAGVVVGVDVPLAEIEGFLVR